MSMYLYLVSIVACLVLRSQVEGYLTNKKSSRKFPIKMSLDPSVISLGAGSVAGAIGVGFAYPIDTIRIKVQVYAVQKQDDAKLSLVAIFKKIVESEGIKGFYSGVGGVMLAQAFIKSAAFGSNAWALSEISDYFHLDESHAPLIALAFAAAFSGFVTSFVVNPVERIKVLMQADETKRYSSELDCAAKVVAQDGVQGLIFRGTLKFYPSFELSIVESLAHTTS